MVETSQIPGFIPNISSTLLTFFLLVPGANSQHHSTNFATPGTEQNCIRRQIKSVSNLASWTVLNNSLKYYPMGTKNDAKVRHIQGS